MSTNTDVFVVGDGRFYVCRFCHRSLWKVRGASRQWLATALTLHEQHCRGERYTELTLEPDSAQMPDQERQ